MNLKNIEYFLVLAEELNFTKAAERIYISQQALSSMVQRMEEEYGIKLLERKPTLRLTAAGEALTFYGRQMLDKEKQLMMTLADISKQCSATLRLGISRLRSSAYFGDIWQTFHQKHANISFELVDGRSNKFEKLLRDGKISMYIGVDVTEGIHEQIVELVQEKSAIYMSLEFLKGYYPDDWRQKFEHFRDDGISIAEISEMPFILQRSGNRMRESLNSYLAQGQKLHVILESDQQEFIYKMVQMGAGVGIASPTVAYLHKDEVNRPGSDCWIFRMRDELHVNRVNLVYRTDYPMLDYERDFIEIAKAVFAQEPVKY